MSTLTTLNADDARDAGNGNGNADDVTEDERW